MSTFLFVICQTGAEPALKDEIARRHKHFRFAFSRPGFVTFKVPDDVRRDRQFELKSTFARTWGFSIGKVTGETAEQLAADFRGLIEERFPEDGFHKFSHLHVWERDRCVPGDNGYEPGITPLAGEAGHLIRDAGSDLWRTLKLNEIAAREDRIFDCVLVEPNEWWIGWHRATDVPSTWPGGVPDFEIEQPIVSRTYLKMAEALLWSGLPIQPGDAAVEIGSAPGGSCQALLERGLAVTGVDPAEMDETLLSHPYFTHLKARAKDLKQKQFSGFRWLMSDASVAPRYTLDTVERIVTSRSVKIEGLLLTLKLTDWKQAERVPEFHKRVRSWGYRFVRSRQLAYNRREICLAASDLVEK